MTDTLNPSSALATRFAHLHKQCNEAQIRLYGVLWLLVEQHVISQGRARELANRPLTDLIAECQHYLDTQTDEIRNQYPTAP